MYIGIGVYGSSLSRNPIVAVLLARVTGLFFHLLFGVLARGQTGMLSTIFEYLSARSHFESISRGVFDTRDLVYFLSITFLGLFLSTMALGRSEEHTSELQSRPHLVCRLLLEKKK